MCTAGLVDGSQRANVWWYVVPAVEGNAENLHKIQCGMNLWLRIRPLHQCGTTNPMCKCRPCPLLSIWSRVVSRVQPSPTQLCTQRYAIRCAASCKRNTAGTTCGACLQSTVLQVLRAPVYGALEGDFRLERGSAMAMQFHLPDRWPRCYGCPRCGTSYGLPSISWCLAVATFTPLSFPLRTTGSILEEAFIPCLPYDNCRGRSSSPFEGYADRDLGSPNCSSVH